MYQSETKHLLNRFVVDSALVSSSRSPRHEQIVSTCFQRVGDTVTKESPARKKTPQDSLRSKSGYNPMHLVARVLYGIKPPSNRRIRTSLSRNLDKKKEVRPIKATSCSATPSEIRSISGDLPRNASGSRAASTFDNVRPIGTSLAQSISKSISLEVPIDAPELVQ